MYAFTFYQRMSSTGTWAALMPQPVASYTRWQMQPRSWTWGWLVFSLLMTELWRPFITLALSELKEIRLSHGMPLFLLDTGKNATKLLRQNVRF